MILDLNGYGILWDMDGVLVDSGDAHFLSWKEIFNELGLEFSFETFQETFGMNNKGILKKLCGERATDDFIAQVGDRKERLFRDMVRGHVEIFPGVVHWLERFSELGAKQAIASSAPPENISAQLAEVGVEIYLDAIVSGFDMPGKPNPDVFLAAAKEICINPQKCVVIEDAVAGVEGAKRAGMKCIAVTTTNSRDALQGADYVFDSLEELTLEHIKSILL
jgi:beta-phosphoglucomutase-like phosphatase (HAD superfamily)